MDVQWKRFELKCRGDFWREYRTVIDCALYHCEGCHGYVRTDEAEPDDRQQVLTILVAHATLACRAAPPLTLADVVA